jgi:putative ABC transport system permease protein
MILWRVIITNLLRHRTRTLISVSGIAFSVAAMMTVITVLQGAVGMFSGLLSSDSEMIVFERNVSDLFFSNVSNRVFDQITLWPEVTHADPVLFGIVSSPDHPIITCFGVKASDARLRKAIWRKGSREQFSEHEDGVVLGERAAEFLKADQGSIIPVGHGAFSVIGIIHTSNGFEDGGVFMPLHMAQQFFHKDGSSVITIKLHNAEDRIVFQKKIQSAFPDLVALEDGEFNRSYSQFRILKATAWTVGGCGLLLGGFGVANTMIMSVFTRIREIAILRVNGFSHLQISTVILAEALLIAWAGAVLGLLIGSLLLIGLGHIPSLHGYIDATLQPGIMLLILLLALLTGAVGSLYPALYAVRIRAVEALRFE